MTVLSKQNANEINRLHGIATETANSAIEMAKQIGLLLLAVKDDLGHGEFGTWVDANPIGFYAPSAKIHGCSAGQTYIRKAFRKQIRHGVAFG